MKIKAKGFFLGGRGSETGTHQQVATARNKSGKLFLKIKTQNKNVTSMNKEANNFYNL